MKLLYTYAQFFLVCKSIWRIGENKRNTFLGIWGKLIPARAKESAYCRCQCYARQKSSKKLPRNCHQFSGE